MKRMAVWALLILAALSFSTSAMAQDRVKYKKRTVIDLSASVIEGDLTRPEGSYIVNRKASRFSSLIQDRSNFYPELMASSNDL
jgi:hypothetical protein